MFFGVSCITSEGTRVRGYRVEEERAGGAIGGEGIVWCVDSVDVTG